MNIQIPARIVEIKSYETGSGVKLSAVRDPWCCSSIICCI
jgi:hypothetical protein